MTGKPDYDAMTPALAAVVRKQMPAMQPGMASLGPVRSIQFLGVSNQGCGQLQCHARKGRAALDDRAQFPGGAGRAPWSPQDPEGLTWRPLRSAGDCLTGEDA